MKTNKGEDIKNGTLAAIQHLVLPSMGVFLTQYPHLVPMWLVAHGFLGVLFQFKQDEINECINLIRDNPEAFSEKITQTKAFQDAFVVILEAYLKERLVKKREIMQRAILGFCESEEKERFELERINSVISRISIEAVEFLDFINTEIAPNLHKQCDELATIYSENGTGTKESWLEHLMTKEPISQLISNWIHNEYDPGSEKVKKRHNYTGGNTPEQKKLLSEIFDIRRPKDQWNSENSAELLNLGILRTVPTGSGGLIGGGGPTIENTVTRFGWKFIQYVAPNPFFKLTPSWSKLANWSRVENLHII